MLTQYTITNDNEESVPLHVCIPLVALTVCGSALVLAEIELGPAYLSAPPDIICCEYIDCACERSYPVVATT